MLWLICACWCEILVALFLRPGYLLDQLHLDQDLSSYVFFFKYSCVHRNKSKHAGCFPGVNPPTLKSDMKFLGKLATNLMAVPLFLFFRACFYLCYNLKIANPFTFVGYLFIGFLWIPVFRSPRPLFSPPSDVDAPLSPLWANGDGLRALILGLESTPRQLSLTGSPRLNP